MFNYKGFDYREYKTDSTVIVKQAIPGSFPGIEDVEVKCDEALEVIDHIDILYSYLEWFKSKTAGAGIIPPVIDTDLINQYIKDQIKK